MKNYVVNKYGNVITKEDAPNWGLGDVFKILLSSQKEEKEEKETKETKEVKSPR